MLGKVVIRANTKKVNYNDCRHAGHDGDGGDDENDVDATALSIMSRIHVLRNRSIAVRA